MEEKSKGQLRKNPAVFSVPVSHARIAFVIVIAAAFLDVIDFSIIQVALPTIRTEFAVSLADSQWIVGAYGITMAGFLMLSGRAGDIYGQKTLFVSGIVLFTIASASGGLAPSLLSLIVSRLIQGVGAAISSVTALSIFQVIFPEGPGRNRALGVFVAIISAGFAAGSLMGGVLTTTLGWRSVMFVNVPIGIAATALSILYLPSAPGRLIGSHLDLPGAASVTGGMMLLIYSLTNAATFGFSSPDTLLPLALSVLALAVFIIIESRSRAPLMPLSFLRRGDVLTANILALILTSASGGLGFVLTVYMQTVLGYSALDAGFGFLPPAVIFFVVGGWGSPWLVNRYGIRKVLLVSLAFVALGIGLLSRISPSDGYVGIAPGMTLWALGASIGFPVLSIAALSGTRPGEEGLASGLITTSQRLGFPMGLAVLVAIASFIPADPSSPDTIVGGFRLALLAAALFSLIGLVIALRIKEPSTSWRSQGLPSG